jgi:hypothetical protein
MRRLRGHAGTAPGWSRCNGEAQGVPPVGWVPFGISRRRTAFLALVLVSAAAAHAHVNDRGMDYRAYQDSFGVPCCSKEDCRPADDFIEAVENGREVVRLLIDGTWITVSRQFLVEPPSTDGRAHWCGLKLVTGNPKVWRPGTRCIILPPKML